MSNMAARLARQESASGKLAIHIRSPNIVLRSRFALRNGLIYLRAIHCYSHQISFQFQTGRQSSPTSQMINIRVMMYCENFQQRPPRGTLTRCHAEKVPEYSNQESNRKAAGLVYFLGCWKQCASPCLHWCTCFSSAFGRHELLTCNNTHSHMHSFIHSKHGIFPPSYRYLIEHAPEWHVFFGFVYIYIHLYFSEEILCNLDRFPRFLVGSISLATRFCIFLVKLCSIWSNIHAFICCFLFHSACIRTPMNTSTHSEIQKFVRQCTQEFSPGDETCLFLSPLFTDLNKGKFEKKPWKQCGRRRQWLFRMLQHALLSSAHVHQHAPRLHSSNSCTYRLPPSKYGQKLVRF